MDIDIAYQRISSVMKQLQETVDIDGNVNAMKPQLRNLVDAWEGLDSWLRREGMLPKEWTNAG